MTDTAGTVLSAFVKFGFLAYIANQCRLSVDAVAGQTTFVSFFGKLTANVTFNQWAAYVFGGGGVIYGVAQRHLRKKTVKNLSSRIQTLEKSIDPDRSSSRLKPDGTTPKDY